MGKLVLILSIVISSLSFAADADGCFQSYLPGSMYPAICVSGSNHEATVPTAKIAIFGTNTDRVVWCAQVTGIDRKEAKKEVNHVVFEFDPSTGMKSIEFEGQVEDKREKGYVTFEEKKDTIKLQYMRISSENTEKLLKSMHKSELCDK